MQLVKIVSGPAGRNKRHQKVEATNECRPFGKKSQAYAQPQDVPVDGQNRLPQIAEAQCRCGNLGADTVECLQPSHSGIRRICAKEQEAESAALPFDLMDGGENVADFLPGTGDVCDDHFNIMWWNVEKIVP